MSIAGRLTAWADGARDDIARAIGRVRLYGWRRELRRLVFEGRSLVPFLIAVVMLTLAIETPIACVVLSCL